MPLPALALDPRRTIAEKVADLLARMTPAEKVAQLSARHWGRTPSGQWAELPDDLFVREIPHGIGQICQLGKRRPRAEAARLANRVQRFCREQTRLGIPALCHEETLHGMIAADVTCLPTPLTLGATWLPDAVRQGFAVVGDEMRRAGLHIGLSPVIDLAREPRWGRSAETFGEDPVAVAHFAVAAVRGLQEDPAGRLRLLATGKHFVGYSQGEGGHNAGPFQGSTFELCSVHLVPWLAAIRDGGLRCVMPSYAAVEGRPCHANTWLLRHILRERLGFIGLTIADYGGVAELHDLHGVTADLRESAHAAILAGLDHELPNGECYDRTLADLTRDPAVARAVDEAVARTLTAKFELGLFEQPYVDESAAGSVDLGADDTARFLADEAVVLLENPGHILPIDPARLRRVAVIGPHADENLLGPYYGSPRQNQSHFAAIRDFLGDGVVVEHAPGCRITGPALSAPTELNPRDPGKDHSTVQRSTAADDAAAIAAAVELSRRADLTVLIVGDDFTTTGESFRAAPKGDRADLGLWGGQKALLEALRHEARQSGRPLVVVLARMGAISEPELMDGRLPLLDAGTLGQAAGAAVAAVLFGANDPRGRLSHSVPRSAGHLPCHGSAPAAARRGYGLDPNRPLYPLGYGLAYTTFALSDATLLRPRVRLGEPLAVHVTLTNTGPRAGSEVVYVHHRDVVCRDTRPARELVAFTKVRLTPGESRQLVLTVPAERLGWLDADACPQQEPGLHRLWLSTGAAPDSTALGLEAIVE
jgi:beta-glucosidase